MTEVSGEIKQRSFICTTLPLKFKILVLRSIAQLIPEDEHKK